VVYYVGGLSKLSQTCDAQQTEVNIVVMQWYTNFGNNQYM
jgi:hypothetical protein